MRTRPVFARWGLQAHGFLDTAEINFADFRAVAESAGQRIGLGDGRPLYGRFACEVKEL